MIYGYSNKVLNDYGLMEMREVTFQAPPVVLREVAKFFLAMADLMETNGFSNCSHRHIGSVISNWDTRFPEKDIVILPPQA
jgi:hypothetical protein